MNYYSLLALRLSHFIFNIVGSVALQKRSRKLCGLSVKIVLDLYSFHLSWLVLQFLFHSLLPFQWAFRKKPFRCTWAEAIKKQVALVRDLRGIANRDSPDKFPYLWVSMNVSAKANGKLFKKSDSCCFNRRRKSLCKSSRLWSFVRGWHCFPANPLRTCIWYNLTRIALVTRAFSIIPFSSMFFRFRFIPLWVRDAHRFFFSLVRLLVHSLLVFVSSPIRSVLLDRNFSVVEGKTQLEYNFRCLWIVQRQRVPTECGKKCSRKERELIKIR